jgi:hypothetical protein
LEHSLALQREAKVELRFASICANLGSVYCEHYQFAEAERVLAEGLAVAVERDLDRMQAFMEGWQALMYMQQGRWSEATELATQSIQRATSGQIGIGDVGPECAPVGDAAAAEALNAALRNQASSTAISSASGMIRARWPEPRGRPATARLAGARPGRLRHCVGQAPSLAHGRASLLALARGR